MQLRRLLIPTLLLSLSAQAQEQEPKRSKETLGLIDQARALPPEFCADVLLRVAGSSLIPDAQWKRELIEEAFTAGAHAQLPYERIADGLAVDARTNQEYARNGLEAITLQTRGVEAMLAIDAPHALTMFQDIVLPALPREKCDTPAVANVDSYYASAVKVFATGFTPKQRQKEEDLQFLELLIARMQSPTQLPAVMRMIFVPQVNAEHRKRLLTAYAVALDRVSGSDRAYGAVEGTLVPGGNPDFAAAAMFLPALRSYIVRQVSGPRCSDTIKPGKLPTSVTGFNTLALKMDPGSLSLKPITEDEAKPGKDEGTFRKDLPFGSSTRSKQVLMALKRLDHGDTNPARRWTPEERKSVEWNDHFNDLLKLIEGWKESDEDTPEEFLINVAQTYSSLAANAPPAAAKENVMGRYLNFIETHYDPAGKRNLWFTQVVSLMRRTRRDQNAEQWVLQHFGRSANPVIALYTKLETLQIPRADDGGQALSPALPSVDRHHH